MALTKFVVLALAVCCGLLLLQSSSAEAAATGATGSSSSNSAATFADSVDSDTATETLEKLIALEMQLKQLSRAVERLLSQPVPAGAGSVEKRRTRMREIHLV